jgi:hypothetical protein
LRPSARKVVVSDAGPLIALGRLDQLGLLPTLFARVHVPQAVLAERQARPLNLDAVRISAAVDRGWLSPCEATPIAAQGLTTEAEFVEIPWVVRLPPNAQAWRSSQPCGPAPLAGT